MKLITCVLFKNIGDKVIHELFKKGVYTASLHHARGSAIGDQIQKDGLPVQFQKDLLTVLVDSEQADEMFELIYEIAEIDKPHSGFMYMETLKKATHFELPKNLPFEEEKKTA